MIQYLYNVIKYMKLTIVYLGTYTYTMHYKEKQQIARPHFEANGFPEPGIR